MSGRDLRKNGPVAIAFHTVVTVFIAAPLVVVMLVSQSEKGYLSMPFNDTSLRWYREIPAAPELISAFWLSIWLGLAIATIAQIVAVPASLAVARHRFVGRDGLLVFLMSPLMIPHVVLGVAFLHSFAIMEWTGPFIALVLVHAITVVLYSLRLSLAAVIGLERDAEAAARSLSASRPVSRRVLLPPILPCVAAGRVMAFNQNFDEVTMKIFVATPGATTRPVALYNRRSQLTDPMTTSVSTILILGTMAFMILLDRMIGLDKILVGEK